MKKLSKSAKERLREDDVYEIHNEIYKYIHNLPQYVYLFASKNCMLAAKKVTLNICYTANAEGFQPLERTEQCEKWVMFITRSGGYLTATADSDIAASYNFIAHLLDKGVPEILIRSKDEIAKKLGEV